ncbi:MAG: hypothetical protein LBJ63_00090 [Prevotellaceae bacterium]|nr:hypothetical protein [Prevotellaceae bacterium]
MKNIQGKSESKRCVCIPIDENSLFVSEFGGIYLSLAAWENSKLKNGKTHLIKPFIPKPKRDLMSQDELKNLPVVGDVKPVEQKKETPKSEPEQTTPVDDMDDLPF